MTIQPAATCRSETRVWHKRAWNRSRPRSLPRGVPREEIAGRAAVGVGPFNAGSYPTSSPRDRSSALLLFPGRLDIKGATPSAAMASTYIT
jgi:hypothetical protein